MVRSGPLLEGDVTGERESRAKIPFGGTNEEIPILAIGRESDNLDRLGQPHTEP